jgi:hypothetical protein
MCVRDTFKYVYGSTCNVDNLLVNGPNGASLAYDPLGRHAQTIGGGVTTRFACDGAMLIAEYNASNAMLRRAACPREGGGARSGQRRTYCVV